MFKVGEKIRFVDNWDGKVKKLSISSIYKVLGVGVWKGKQTVTVRNDWGYETSCYAERFVKVVKDVKQYGICGFWNRIERKEEACV